MQLRMPGVPAERRLNGNRAAHRMRYCELVSESNCPCVQLIQQHLGGLKVRGIEALSEPNVCFRKHLARFVAPTLLLVKARQTCSRSELPRFAQLVPRCSDRSTKVIFGIPIL